MSKRKKLVIGMALFFGLALLFNHKVQFVLGGAMVNLGYRFQDHLKTGVAFNQKQEPEKIWGQIRKQNKMSASIRSLFPKTTHKPKVAILICMDARLDDDELTGDTRQLYYIIRTAGSVLPRVEQDMLELAIEKGVEVVVLTTHHDCAAEAASKDPVLSKKLPHLCQAVKHRQHHIREFVSRPRIKEKIKNGQLIVVHAHIDPTNGMMVPDDEPVFSSVPANHYP